MPFFHLYSCWNVQSQQAQSMFFFPTETITDACFKESGQEATVTQTEGEHNKPTVGAFDLQTFA